MPILRQPGYGRHVVLIPNTQVYVRNPSNPSEKPSFHLTLDVPSPFPIAIVSYLNFNWTCLSCEKCEDYACLHKAFHRITSHCFTTHPWDVN